MSLLLNNIMLHQLYIKKYKEIEIKIKETYNSCHCQYGIH